jgi:hypothetical protein
MFANPLWSILVLVGLGLCYALIRYKHGGPLLATSDSWPEWLLKFRSWVLTIITGVGVALPDLAVAILPLDLSWLIGPEYAPKLSGALNAYLAINTFFKTTKPQTEIAS